MRKLWSALFVAVLVGSVGTASAQMRGGGSGWHGGHFHDGRFSQDGRFHHSHTNSGVFIGAPAFWWGAPYYPYDYPASYGGSFAGPIYGGPDPATYIQQDISTAFRGSEYWHWCTDSATFYRRDRHCANDLFLVVPDDHAPAVALKSRELNNAERFAKASGCSTPVAKMNFPLVDSFETFAVACESERPMSVRCDNGQCRAM